MITIRQAALACAAAFSGFAAENGSHGRVSLRRVPAGGIQPQAVLDDGGTLHLVYYAGDAHHGDIHDQKTEAGRSLLLYPSIKVGALFRQALFAEPNLQSGRRGASMSPGMAQTTRSR